MIVNSRNLTILNTTYSAAFHAGFGQAPADHEPLTLMVPSMTAEAQYGWLGQVPGLREWVGERVLRGIAEHGYSIRNRKFETTVEVKRDAIEDDQYGVYAPLMRSLGEAAAAHPCELVYEALLAGFWTECYDGQYFFDADHAVQGSSVSNLGGAPNRAQLLSGDQHAWYLVCANRAIKPILHQTRTPYEFETLDSLDDENVFIRDAFYYGCRGRGSAGYGLWQLAYGSVEALNEDNYRAARRAIHEALGDEGRALGYRPTHLVYPPALDHDALTLLNAERNANGSTNVYRGTATGLMSPWLPS